MKRFAIALTFIVLLFCSYFGVEWYKSYQYQNQKFDIEELSKNPDFTGIIEIKNVLSEPVMKRDNSYYLTHSADGTPNPNGCVFVDDLYNEESTNMVLYGHNSHNGTVFSNLVKYMDGDFSSKNSLLTYTPKDGTSEQYKLVYVYNYNANDVETINPYLPVYPEDYLSRISFYACYYQDGKLDEDIITLSTCEESLYGQAGRLILVWRKL